MSETKLRMLRKKEGKELGQPVEKEREEITGGMEK